MFESWAMDVRYVMRRLRKRPTYALLAVVTLSLGVAGPAAVYPIMRPLLWEPLPVQSEERIAVFWASSWSEEEFAYLRPQLDGFQSAALYSSRDVTLRRGDAPAMLMGAVSASAELFDVLGVHPVIGAGFQPGDDRQGAGRVAVLSHSLWRELGGDSAMIGQRIELGGDSWTVVGVMPPGFWFPDPNVRAWLSMWINPEDPAMNYDLIGRLNAGIGIGAMRPRVDRIATLLSERFTYHTERWDKTRNAELTPLREFLVGPVRPALLALLGAMALILLIACVNVSALMLGQVDGRRTELAVRTALGAARQRLLRQLVAESLVIGLLAGLVSTGLAILGFRVLVSTLPLGALGETATVDWTLLWVAIAVALAAATVVALVPGASVVRGDIHSRLIRRGIGRTPGHSSRLEGALVVAQVALVLLMMSGAALLIRSVANLRDIDPGVETSGVGVIDVVMPGVPMEDRIRIVHELVATIQDLLGVASVAVTQKLPLRGAGNFWGIQVENRPELEATSPAFRMVTADYFATLGIGLRDGRGLLVTDRLLREEGVVVINQALASQYFRGMNPIGQRISFWHDRWDRIVGVVDDVAESELTGGAEPALYMLYENSPGPDIWLNTSQTIVFRTQDGQNPATLLDPARRAIQAAAPEVAIDGTTTMARVFQRAMGPARQLMALLSLLSGLALALGVVGVYGVVSHAVGRSKRDWGIRMALGMRSSRVVGRIVRGTGVLVGTGIALGLLAFLVLSRLLARFLYGVDRLDPVALTIATAVLLAAGLLAAYIPGRRASRIDPAMVLREE